MTITRSILADSASCVDSGSRVRTGALERAAAGEEIIIAKAGKPLAKLIRYEPEQTVKRKPGFWRGRVKLAEDLDTLPEEVAAAFRGERP